MKKKVKDKQIEIISYLLRNRHIFTFHGGFKPIFSNGEGMIHFDLYLGRDFIESFFQVDSLGEYTITKHPTTLLRLLEVKAAINLQIKTWAQSRADGTLPLILFSKRIILEKLDKEKDSDYINIINNSSEDIESQLKLPNWIIEAVENQKSKYYKEIV